MVQASPTERFELWRRRSVLRRLSRWPHYGTPNSVQSLRLRAPSRLTESTSTISGTSAPWRAYERDRGRVKSSPAQGSRFEPIRLTQANEVSDEAHHAACCETLAIHQELAPGQRASHAGIVIVASLRSSMSSVRLNQTFFRHPTCPASRINRDACSGAQVASS